MHDLVTGNMLRLALAFRYGSKLFLKKHRKKDLAAKLSAQKNQANDADSKPLHSIFYLILAVFSKFIFFQWKPHGYSILTILT